MAVAGILTMIALPSVRKANARWAVEEATQQFVSDVTKAQAIAIKANRPVTVKRVGQTGYRVDGGDTRLLPTGVTFLPGSPDSVRFVSFGPPTSGASAFTLRGESRTVTVSVNAAGRISR
jgi:Tfp pilus assembly protein FimT